MILLVNEVPSIIMIIKQVLHINWGKKLNQSKRFIILGAMSLFILFLACVIWYSPAVFKGYPTYTMTGNYLLGRNIYQTALYSAENDFNVILSSNLIKNQGHPSALGNKLTSHLYAQLFRIIGLPNNHFLILISIILHALVLLLFTYAISYLFNFKIAFLFSLIYIFLPFNWCLPYHLGTYEFALLFLASFFLCYFFWKKHKKKSFFLITSGVFLVLSCLSKEALFIVAAFLFCYLWLIKQKKTLTYIFVPFIIVCSFYYLPQVKNNAYMQLFTTHVPEHLKAADFATFGHVYPDPYTYHFESKNYLSNLRDKIINNKQSSSVEKIEIMKSLKNTGIQDVGLIDRIKIGLILSFRHLFRFVSLDDFGGPFMFLLFLLGLYNLRQRNKHLAHFFMGWILFSIFLFSFIILTGRSHLMDFNLAIALFITLGLITLSQITINFLNLKKGWLNIFLMIFLCTTLYNCVLSSHISWSRIYDENKNLLVNAYAQEVIKKNISDNAVIAANLHFNDIINLAYSTNKSVVKFAPKTIENLLKNNKLSLAFKTYNIQYVIGYTDELTQGIIKQTHVSNIAHVPVKTIQMSSYKNFLMNIMK